MVGVCLIAVFAIAAVAATSASALPEWGKCVAKAGGKYTNSNCTTKGKGGTFEYLKASQVSEKRVAEGKSANIPFSGNNVGSGGVLRTGGLVCQSETEIFLQRMTREHCLQKGGKPSYSGEEGISVECEAENNTGEAEGKNKVANVHVTFTGCKLFGSIPCNSEGDAEGEIKVKPLKGALGYLNKAAKEVGVMLEPATKKGLFAKFLCGTGAIETSVGVGNSKEGAFYLTSGCIGSCETATPKEEAHGGYDQIISPITPVNAMTNEFTQVYKVSTISENIPSKFEGKHISLLEDSVRVVPQAPNEKEGIMWSPAGEEITNVNTPEEEGMIKA